MEKKITNTSLYLTGVTSAIWLVAGVMWTALDHPFFGAFNVALGFFYAVKFGALLDRRFVDNTL